MLIMTTDSLLVETSVAVMIVDGSSLVAMSLSFSTLASDNPWRKGVKAEEEGRIVSRRMHARAAALRTGWRQRRTLILSRFRLDVILTMDESRPGEYMYVSELVVLLEE